MSVAAPHTKPDPDRHDSGPERKRKRLLKAAASCFARLGFAKATVDEIAKTAGISKGLVYVHFSSKEELLEAVLEETLDTWHQAAWTEVLEQADDVCSTLQTFHRVSIQYALRTPLLRRILERDAYLLLATVDAPARDAMNRWRSELVALLERGVETGELRRDLDIERTADVIRLLHLSYLERLFEYDDIDTADPELVDAGISLLIAGMVPRPSRSH